MPIYEYQCQHCHHEFDLMQKINDKPVQQCPMCLDNTVIRLVSAAGFQLKGTGWYATDYKDKGKPVKTSTNESSASEDKKEKKTESTSSKTAKGDSE